MKKFQNKITMKKSILSFLLLINVLFISGITAYLLDVKTIGNVLNVVGLTTVHLDGNGGTDSSIIKFPGRELGDLPDSTRNGYTFVEWNTKSDGSGTKITESSLVPENNTTYYAKWNINTYSISYNLNGGTNPSGISTSYTIESDAITLPTPTRTGYTFNGWYTSSSFSESPVTSIAKGSTGNKTFYAKWTANNYTYNIVYNSSSGTQLGTSTIKKAYGTTNTVSPKAYTGYTSPSSQSITWDSTSAKTITFTYTPITYDITIDCNGGSGVSSTSYTIETDTFSLGTPSRSGYTFTGWTGSNGTTAQTSVSIVKGSTGDKTYTANWATINYSISYVLNGGTNPSGATSSYTIESSSITLPTPTRDGYAFEGWYTSSSFSGSAVTTIAKGSSGNKTFYAKWRAPSAFAIYSSTDTSLRFYNNTDTVAVGDTYRGLYVDAIYTGFETATYASAAKVPWYRHIWTATKVVVEEKIKPVSLSYWFAEYYGCSTLDVEKIDTSQVTETVRTFYYTGRDASAFSITGMDNWDVSNVSNMSRMFEASGRDATSWNIGDLSKWNVSSVTDMSYQFNMAGYKTTVWDAGNINNWDVSSVTDMKYMFRNAAYTATTWNIDLSDWDVSSVSNMNYMFSSSGCSLQHWTVGDIGKWNVSGVTTMKHMFSNAGYDATTYSLDINNWNVAGVTDMYGFFCRFLQNATTWSFDFSKWNVSSVSDMRYMFEYAGSDSSKFELKGLQNWNVSSVTTMQYMFAGAGQDATTCSLGNLSTWNVSNVTIMFGMFSYCGQYSTTWVIGDISKWNVSNVTDMYRMFYQAGASASYTLNLKGWNVAKVTNYSDFNTGVTTKVLSPF